MNNTTMADGYSSTDIINNLALKNYKITFDFIYNNFTGTQAKKVQNLLKEWGFDVQIPQHNEYKSFLVKGEISELHFTDDNQRVVKSMPDGVEPAREMTHEDNILLNQVYNCTVRAVDRIDELESSSSTESTAAHIKTHVEQIVVYETMIDEFFSELSQSSNSKIMFQALIDINMNYTDLLDRINKGKILPSLGDNTEVQDYLRNACQNFLNSIDTQNVEVA